MRLPVNPSSDKNDPVIETGVVKIYRALLNCAVPADRSNILSVDELARANRFRFPIHRDRFIVGRTTLRQVLARHLRQLPHQIDFSYTDSGKPFVDGESVSFNLSNSGDLCLIALGKYAHIGVDIEQHVANKEFDDIARRFFAPAEVQELMGFDPERRMAAFYACWTRKEAFVKAHGKGLVYGLDRFAVSANSDGPAMLLSIGGVDTGVGGMDGSLENPNAWSLFNLDIDPGYSAALAVHGTVERVERFNWDGA